MTWLKTSDITSKKYTCGYCSTKMASDVGYQSAHYGNIYICSHCDEPTFFSDKEGQIPSVSFGISVKELPEEIERLYNEARQCMKVSAYTSAVMLCRKLLMYIAVENGAKINQSFINYVDWLDESGYIPPNGKALVDYIRQKGNEANHEIRFMEQQDAEHLITFIGMFMMFVYEFPASLPDQETS